MGQKLKDIELYKRVDEIIWNDWDPIGVNKYEEARSEYYSYLPSLYIKLIEGHDAKAIKKYLDHIETVNMGLSGNPQRNIQIAEKLIEVRNEFHSF